MVSLSAFWYPVYGNPDLMPGHHKTRLLDPRTAAASRAAGLGAATMQRRMEQLVAAHLNVECLWLLEA